MVAEKIQSYRACVIMNLNHSGQCSKSRLQHYICIDVEMPNILGFSACS